MKASKSEKGFSMVELIIVIAIMGIIGAVLVPYYFNASDKARVTTDVSSMIAVQNQMEVYLAEFGKEPGSSAEDIIEELVDVGYLKKESVGSNWKLNLQTPDSEVFFDSAVNEFRLKVKERYYNLCKDNDNVVRWLTKVP